MNNKTLRVLSIILLLLVGAWFAQKQFATKREAETAANVQLEPNVDKELISAIKIHKDGVDLALNKTGEGWTVQEASESAQAADGFKVGELLDVLDGVPVKLVSQTTDRQAELGVDDASANTLTYLKGEEEVYTLLVSTSNSELIRQKDRQNVYQWSSSLGGMMNTSTQYWLAPTPTPGVASDAAEPSGEGLGL